MLILAEGLLFGVATLLLVVDWICFACGCIVVAGFGLVRSCVCVCGCLVCELWRAV